MITLLALGLGCGKAANQLEADELAFGPSRVRGDLRCEVEEAEAEIVRSGAPSAQRDNVRRFYATRGRGDARQRLLVCREVDTNFDGVMDVVREYDANGLRARELADANYDGRIDTWTTFSDGELASVELDTTRDGEPDELRTYADGKIVRIQRDTNADGKPDRFEIYSQERLERVGVDADFDGRVDRWDRDARPAEPDEKNAGGRARPLPPDASTSEKRAEPPR